jgi:hypothetical protein
VPKGLLRSVERSPEIPGRHFAGRSFQEPRWNSFLVLASEAARESSAGLADSPCEFCFAFVPLPMTPGFPDQILHFTHHRESFMSDAVRIACNSMLEMYDGYSGTLIRIVAIATDGDL